MPPRRRAGGGARLLRMWNWKSAALSALVRATIFLVANAPAGWRAAWGAFGAELAFRAATSGFYGAATQAFAAARPSRLTSAAALVVVPGAAHTLEFAVHYLRGTPALSRSLTLSVAFTVVSTMFHLFAMRRGALVAGASAAPIADDLRRMPRLIVEFVSCPFR